MIGRLRPGVTLEQAEADLANVQAQLAELFPDTDSSLTIHVEPLKDIVVGGSRASLWLLFGAVSMLLLIACTNIAALLLARAARRERELAIRSSLGAPRGTLAGQVLTEAAVLAVTGAALGVAVAFGATTAFRVLAPELPRVHEIAVDVRILLYMSAATVAVTLLCGLLPALRGTRGVGLVPFVGPHPCGFAPLRAVDARRRAGRAVGHAARGCRAAGAQRRRAVARGRRFQRRQRVDAASERRLRHGNDRSNRATHQPRARRDCRIAGRRGHGDRLRAAGVRAEDQREFVLAEGRADAELAAACREPHRHARVLRGSADPVDHAASCATVRSTPEGKDPSRPK